MENPANQVPQVVPSSWCFSCDVCCRFPEKDSFLRPFFTRDEIQGAISAGISSEFFENSEGCQISLIPNPTPGTEGYICPCFDPGNGHCKIYQVRPLDCQLYPVALMRDERDEGVVIGLDTKCPYIKERGSDEELSHYIKEVATHLEIPTSHERISKNPGLVQRYQDDVICLYPVESLTKTLKSPDA
jgi:uncharacterized protein